MACSTAAPALYPDNVNNVGAIGGPLCNMAGSPATASGNSSGPAWWTMMNNGLYDDGSPPAVMPQTSALSPSAGAQSGGGGAASGASPASAPAPPAAASTASTSPASVGSAGASGPLHIPAKRLGSYGDCVEPGVIRHAHHGAQPWNYPETHHAGGAFDPASLNHHQYSNTPTYYNLAGDPSRDRKPSSLSFWSPAASASGGAGDYGKYGSGSTTTASEGGCHQGFGTQACWNYTYGAARHEHPTQVPYLAGEERGRVAGMAAAAMAAAESAAAGFGHDTYGLRNYAPEPVPAAPYPPPGNCLHLFIFIPTQSNMHARMRKPKFPTNFPPSIIRLPVFQ